MSPTRVLICGAGVSGSIVAYWLGKHGFDVTVIERSRASQKAGQGIEIEEPALQVVKAMGVLEELQERKTGELGFQLEGENAHNYATFPIGDGFSPTGALELMRGDLVETLFKAADQFPNVKYEFETSISSLQQDEEKCLVTLDHNRGQETHTREYDLVIGADGVKSNTRRLVMGTPEELKCYHDIGAYVAYFSIPKQDRDWPNSRLCNFPGRRIIWIRPVSKDTEFSSVYLIHLAKDIPDLRKANEIGDREAQKQILADIYRGCAWEGSRVVEQMLKAKNFYSDTLQQVKLKTWSRGRVALVGDAAWAPTPLTGEGNQLAIMGAWVLAQELCRDASTMAFERYEKRLRKQVEDSQSIPLGGNAPLLFCPQTSLGITVLRNVFRVLSTAVGLFRWANLGRFMPDSKPDYFDLQME